AELVAAQRQAAGAVALLARLLAQLAVDAQVELADPDHLARHADALADEEVEQLLLDARHPREPLAAHAERAAQPGPERRMAYRELGDPAVIERDQHRGRRRVERDRLAARRRERARVEQVALHEQRDVLERDPGERRRLDQRLLLPLLLGRVLVLE